MTANIGIFWGKLILPKMLLVSWACKEISNKPISGSVHSTAIRRAFSYAVCCTKLFKKPSALCKEITFLGGEEIHGRGVGGVQWYSPMVLNHDL